MVALTGFSYLQTLSGTPSMPHEFLNENYFKNFVHFRFVHSYHFLLWLHPLCHLSPCVPFTGQHQIFIASLFFNKLCTCASAISPHSSILIVSIQKVKSDRLGIHFSDDLFFVLPNIFISFFFRLTFSVISVILWIPLYFLSYCHYFYFYCHSVLAFMLPPALLPNFLCPAFLSISCLCSKSCSSSTLHGEILCKGRKPGWEWGWSCGRARGYWRRRWGQYRR